MASVRYHAQMLTASTEELHRVVDAILRENDPKTREDMGVALTRILSSLRHDVGAIRIITRRPSGFDTEGQPT